MRVRIFADEKTAKEFVEEGSVYRVPATPTFRKATRAFRTRSETLRRGHFVDFPVEVLPLKDGTFAVPVALDVQTVREKDARNVDYDRKIVAEKVDPVAVVVRSEDIKPVDEKVEDADEKVEDADARVR